MDWPADNKPALFSELTFPLVSAMRFAYNLRRRHRGEDIPYFGVNVGGPLTAARKRLSAENLAVEAANGVHADEMIIALAVQIGIEQGRRLAAAEQSEASPVCAPVPA